MMTTISTSSGRRKSGKRILLAIAIIALAFISLQLLTDMYKGHRQLSEVAQVMDIEDMELSGHAILSNVAETRICINTPPVFDYDCNLTDYVFNRSTTFSCTVNATDPNGDTITFTSQWLTSTVMFNITPSGNIAFTPPRDSMGGINTFVIHAQDDSGCLNNDTGIEFNTTVVGENRAPYLSKNLTNQQISKDRYAIITSLNDYFTDPDSDPLSYFFILSTGNTVKITIVRGQVMIKGMSCGTSTVYFVAADPFGLTAHSNTVSYEVTCDEEAPAEQASSDSSGGGGGGGSGRTETCNPNWKCGSWSSCQIGNFSYRRCLDYGGCSDQYEHYMFENCTYTVPSKCAENWDCNEWSLCQNGVKTRMCLDLATCGTNQTKPPEMEDCGTASCFNGVQDGNETGIDCGGACSACKNVESPTGFNRMKAIIIMSASAAGLALIGLLAYSFRLKIHRIYLKILGIRTRFKRKEYITKVQKDKLVKILNVAQVRLDECLQGKISARPEYIIEELSEFHKEYFKELLAMDIIERKELIVKITKLKDKSLERLLVMMYARMSVFHQSATALLEHLKARDNMKNGQDAKDGENNTITIISSHSVHIIPQLQALIDELSHDIYLIAEFSSNDAIDSAKDRTMDYILQQQKTHADIIYNRISKAYIALKFMELVAAKNEYKELLKDYEAMPKNARIIVYNDIVRLSEAINYLEEEYTR